MGNNVNFNAVKAAPNQYVRSDQYNTLVDLVRTLTICDHPHYRVLRTTGGTTLAVNFPPSVAGSVIVPATPKPWDISVSPGMTTGSFNFTVVPGTVNDLIATNIFGTGSGLNIYNKTGVEPDTVIYGNVNISVTSNQISSYTISFDTTIAAPVALNADTPITTFSWCFGFCIGGTSCFRLIGPGSMFFNPTIVTTMAISDPAPNVIPWTTLWTWELSND